jgi:hypothetical protein
VLRVDEGEYGSASRRNDLRRLIEREHLLCQPPTVAEREALDKGFEPLGVKPAFRAAPPQGSTEGGTSPVPMQELDVVCWEPRFLILPACID